MKALAFLVFLVLMALGGLIQAIEGEESTEGYPTCAHLARQMGTWEGAKCVDGDDLIHVRDYDTWEIYHPYGDVYED